MPMVDLTPIVARLSCHRVGNKQHGRRTNVIGYKAECCQIGKHLDHMIQYLFWLRAINKDSNMSSRSISVRKSCYLRIVLFPSKIVHSMPQFAFNSCGNFHSDRFYPVPYITLHISNIIYQNMETLCVES